VQHQRCGQEDPAVPREQSHEVGLDSYRVVVAAQAQSPSHAARVRVNNDAGRDSIRPTQDHVGRFSADAGQLREGLHRPWDLAAMLRDDRPAASEEGSSLRSKETCGSNDGFEILLLGSRHSRRRRIGAEEDRGHLVHPGIGTLCRQDGRHQQLERRSVIELDPRLGPVALEGREHGKSTLAGLPGGFDPTRAPHS
jgi:hypothetical protein